MTERFHRLTTGMMDPAQRDLYEAIAGGPRAAGPQAFELVDENGSLNGPFGLMLQVPHLGAPLQELGAAVRYKTSLTDRCREIAILAVAVVSSSDFEWYAHERVGRTVGLSTAELESIEDGTFHIDPHRDALEAVVYSAAVALTDDSWSDAAYDAASTALTDPELLELTILVGYYRTLAQMMSVFNVGAPEHGSGKAS